MRIINNSRDVVRLRAATRVYALVLVTSTVGLGLAGSAMAADEPDATARAYAQRIAITVCGACHGPHGNSTQPKFPRLAGQNAHYLAAQLKAFRAQTRGDPDAVGYMWGMAAELDDATVEALAAYYAEQKPEPSSAGRDAALVARGREIFEHGIQSEGVPALQLLPRARRARAGRNFRASRVSTRSMS